ncbi:MAG: hypothetical protein OSJ76_03335 [Alphaproteobacteria bacterium]|nr:hypothetical protein [Alphaproteobacteria bacterium]
MRKEIQENLDWYKNKTVSSAAVRKGNLALLATAHFRNGEIVQTTRGRCIWPNPYKADSNVLSRRVWGKES